ncbi:FUN14 domain-containing protein 2 [Gracilariopsis chorda]|uniref:FUN14 domain-containing protein 2 n=1 Tax=Gracilariopsis chorda TaxID=448386 RepID=A0A2V3II92_9FLOR|nr:FUN14 domain-containing protein 2 [Gracilariopsis chorda]|eukprot:PXF41743.1 FUN14 domain-containing protein 2 [Gracilariopsis chorda]
MAAPLAYRWRPLRDMSRLVLCFQPPAAAHSPRICRRAARPKPVLSADASEFFRNTLASATANQLTVGSVLGFATGYATKRVGQLLLVLIGCELVALQLMAQRSWIVVNWQLISRDLSPHVEQDRFDRVMEAIKLKMPFAGAFTASFYAGFRWT